MLTKRPPVNLERPPLGSLPARPLRTRGPVLDPSRGPLEGRVSTQDPPAFGVPPLRNGWIWCPSRPRPSCHSPPRPSGEPSLQTEWVFSDEGMTFLPNARPGLPETPHGIPIRHGPFKHLRSVEPRCRGPEGGPNLPGTCPCEPVQNSTLNIVYYPSRIQ